jgi:hypothetical protein
VQHPAAQCQLECNVHPMGEHYMQATSLISKGESTYFDLRVMDSRKKEIR